MPRKTKKGKDYWIVEVIDSNNELTRIRCWGIKPEKDRVHLNRPYMARLNYDQNWGFSTYAVGKTFRTVLYYDDLATALKFKANQLERNKPNSPQGPIAHSLYKQLVSVREPDYCDKHIHKKAIYSNTRHATKASTRQIRETIKKELLPKYHIIKDKYK